MRKRMGFSVESSISAYGFSENGNAYAKRLVIWYEIFI